MLTLNDLKPGDNAIISEVQNGSADIGYLMELGIMEGTPVRFVKSAPLGDPIEVDLRGYHLSIARSKAQSILVEKE
ncbi:MAG: ferrous iron transport protein A [Calditrichaeota bacterium]|nr:MAG: ferrous iron transport protein A [Calditrichota bacterium]MBL1204644.1 ferrous iron transport protein A [Calditrichota bacterium]NOG44472.1 ferrous iron transport protein A [Calditrichota bacterium]